MNLSISLRKELSSRVLRAKDFVAAQDKLINNQISWDEFSPIFASVQTRVIYELIAARIRRIQQLKPIHRSLEMNEMVQAHYEVIELEAYMADVEELGSFQAVA
jgi:hypothetical protein